MDGGGGDNGELVEFSLLSSMQPSISLFWVFEPPEGDDDESSQGRLVGYSDNTMAEAEEVVPLNTVDSIESLGDDGRRFCIRRVDDADGVMYFLSKGRGTVERWRHLLQQCKDPDGYVDEPELGSCTLNLDVAEEISIGSEGDSGSLPPPPSRPQPELPPRKGVVGAGESGKKRQLPPGAVPLPGMQAAAAMGTGQPRGPVSPKPPKKEVVVCGTCETVNTRPCTSCSECGAFV